MCTITVDDVHTVLADDQARHDHEQAAIDTATTATDLPTTIATLAAHQKRRGRLALGGFAAAVGAASLFADSSLQAAGWHFGAATVGQLTVFIAIVAGGIGAATFACRDSDQLHRAEALHRDIRANAGELGHTGQASLVDRLCDEADGNAAVLHNLLVGAIWLTRQQQRTAA